MTASTGYNILLADVSTHMPLTRHDISIYVCISKRIVSTHMPLTRHDVYRSLMQTQIPARFYSHASYEA